MFDDYMPLRLDLLEDAHLLRIAELLRISDDETFGKLFRVWRWAQRNTITGTITATERTVNRIAGKSGFASAMANAGWLVIGDGTVAIPEWEKWNSKAAKKRADDRDRQRDSRGRRSPKPVTNVTTICDSGHKNNGPTETVTETDVIKVSSKQLSPLAGTATADRVSVSVDECRHLAAKAFSRMGYEGDDAAVLWRSAALVSAEQIAQADFFDACESVATTSPANPIAYFRKTLAARVPNLDELLRRVRLVPRCPHGPINTHAGDKPTLQLRKVIHDSPTD